MGKSIYIFLALVFFLGGAYLWKVTNSGRRSVSSSQSVSERVSRDIDAILVYVGELPITSKDLDWEFAMHTKGVFGDEELQSLPSTFTQFEEGLGPLRQRLLASLIERKMLFQYIKQDVNFDLQNPARFTDCLQRWSDVSNEEFHAKESPQNKERLKARICERAIITQYLKEKVFKNLNITDKQLKVYFDKNQKSFKKPPRVLIRQIVLASEGEAKKLRPKLTRQNFAAMAREYSISPDAEEGGLVGPYARGDMPRVFDEAFLMRRGQIRGILKSTYGFHYILLEEKLRKVDPSFSEVVEEVRDKLTGQRRESAYKELVESALNSIRVHPPKPAW